MIKINKTPTYWRYFREYLKHKDFESIRDAARYELRREGSHKNRIVKSRLGKIHTRKGTNDFQFANFAYEWNVKRFILKNHTRFHYFFDIGAGIGEYGMLMGQKGKHVFLFEPLDTSYRTISMNLRTNRLNTIRAFNFGLGNENTQTSFVVHPVNTGASHALTPGESIPEGFRLAKVEIRKLDAIAPELKLNQDKPILIKIDVEGMEADVLRGAAQFLQSCKDVMIILEDTHSGNTPIKKTLAEIGDFETGRVDNLNMFAIKKDLTE